jgi:hypothetical protein
VDSRVSLEVKSRRQMVQEAFGDSAFEQEFWRQVQEAHEAKQAEQWRAVQEFAEAEEQKLQALRLRFEKAAKRERAATFLREQGFSGLNARRRHRFPLCGRFTYPLHVAVLLNDASVVEVLVCAGANGDLEDSDRLTPLALAFKLNQHGSHERLIVVLSAVSVASAPPPPPPPLAPPSPPAAYGESSGRAPPAACGHCTAAKLVGLVCDSDCGDAA